MAKPKTEAVDDTFDPAPAEQIDPTAIPPETGSANPVDEAASRPGVGAPPPEARSTWLTAVASEAFGPAGHFHDLTAEEAAAAPEGVLVAPTPDQLALRAR